MLIWVTLLHVTENKVYTGDHVPWHIPLDGSESRIQHMLMAEDPQLIPIVCFVQVLQNCCYSISVLQTFIVFMDTL